MLDNPFKKIDLPARILASIDAHQIQSERLIGWAQLVVGLIWASLYTLSPKTFEANMSFEPVPVALALYIFFSVVRLFLLHRGFMANWFLTLSVFIDMTILLTLIWSFHLQYGQPAAFYLKAPTMVYLFVFIALRALRFSAGFVILSGLLAAGGWLDMLYFALATSNAQIWA